MTANLIIILIVLLLAVGAGWLTLKAVRAQRRWVRIAGGAGAGLLTLVLLALVVVAGCGFAIVYFPDAPDVPELAVAGTPEQIARGEYLANISCITCHGTFPDGFSGDPEHLPDDGAINVIHRRAGRGSPHPTFHAT